MRRAAAVIALVMIAGLVGLPAIAASCPSGQLCNKAFLPIVRRDATPTPLPTPPPTITPLPRHEPLNICGLFRSNGLECENMHFEGYDQFGDYLPRRCGGLWRFLIPSMGKDRGGRLFMCYDDPGGMDAILQYYFDWCMTDARLCSWVAFSKDKNVFFQVASDLPESKAKRYQDLINGLP